MKTKNFPRSAAILFTLVFTFLFVNSQAQYLGWNQKKLDRYMDRHAGYLVENITRGSVLVAYNFENGGAIRKMVFYFDAIGECFAYAVEYDLRYGKELNDFIRDRYSYNRSNDHYENKKSKLYYQGGTTMHEIYVTRKEMNNDLGMNTLRATRNIK